MDTLEPEISKVCKEQQLLEQLDGEDLLDQSESEEDDKTVVMETSDLEDDTLDGCTDKSEMVEVQPVVSIVQGSDTNQNINRCQHYSSGQSSGREQEDGKCRRAGQCQSQHRTGGGGRGRLSAASSPKSQHQ